jgi:hypothetical protein
MVAKNNMGVTLEMLSVHTDSSVYHNQALAFYTESMMLWEALARDPNTMIRPFVRDYAAPASSLGFLNQRNALFPRSEYEPRLYINIDKDLPEVSEWEEISPSGINLSDVPKEYR